MKRGWFGPKVFGFGVSPSSWEGWLLTLALAVGLGSLGAAPGISRTQGLWIGAAMVAAYLVIAALTYRGRPRPPSRISRR